MQMNKKPHVKPYGTGGKCQVEMYQFPLTKISPVELSLIRLVIQSESGWVIIVYMWFMIMLCNRWRETRAESSSKRKE